MKYCTECGLKTLQPTGEEDYEEGEYHICLSCGHKITMHSLGFNSCDIADKPITYSPIFSFTEMGLRALMDYGLLEKMTLFSDERFRSPKKGKTIAFRRPQPFPEWGTR